ncbi:MAG TPA: YbhB/YbcL family Raf kinase inhibitor-like protein [Terriglobia bacterium]|nr:YbhB/YbcL family Raf kinase inhibitor-like protein [Terriglobia bacterium]
MKILKYLLWIVPLLIILAIVGRVALTANAKADEDRYHESLPKSLQVRSDNFLNREVMPTEFSCFGTGYSPNIRWSGAPAARSYVLIAMDWDAPSPRLRLFPVVHWILYNIPANVSEIQARSTKPMIDQKKIAVGKNVGGSTEYAPPCPPLGQHEYVFRVYALDVDQIQPETNNKAGVMDAMTGHIITFGELVGLFGS